MTCWMICFGTLWICRRISQSRLVCVVSGLQEILCFIHKQDDQIALERIQSMEDGGQFQNKGIYFREYAKKYCKKHKTKDAGHGSPLTVFSHGSKLKGRGNQKT